MLLASFCLRRWMAADGSVTACCITCMQVGHTGVVSNVKGL